MLFLAAQPKQSSPGYGWFTKTDVLAFLDLTQAGFDKSVRPRLPESAISGGGKGKTVWFHGPTVFSERAKQVARIDPDLIDDEAVTPSDSPALERYRLAKAKLAEHEYAVKEGSYLERDMVLEGMNRCAAHIHRGAEALQRQYGNEAADFLREALTEFKRELSDWLGNTQPDATE